MGKIESMRVASTQPPTPTVTARRSYTASVEAVFDAWTNPTSLEQWFGPPGFSAQVLTHELRVGGAWRFLMLSDAGDGYHHFGTFIEIDPPCKLVFTWATEEQVEGWRDEKGEPTRVTVEFAPSGDATIVTITHEQLITEATRRALTHGWSGSLICLGEFLGMEETET